MLLICNFVITSDVEHHFMWLLDSWCFVLFLFFETSAQVICSFLNQVDVFVVEM